ncbi:MAG: thrombospondin, partial [Acidimicrobiales bacterium]|nr:thrombospondin [Acidimicrobiales bacterium]
MSNRRTTDAHRGVHPRAALVVACLLLVALGMAFVHSGSARAATYPLAPYGDTAGIPICDGLDNSPSYADITCNSTDNASAYIGSDGIDVTAGFIDHVDPRSNSGQAPLFSTAFVVQIASGGTQVATIGVDGKGTGDSDLIYAKCAGSAANNWSKLFSTGVTDGSAAVTPEPGPEGYYRLAFTIPLSSLASCGVTATTPVQLFYGTSQAGNLDVINKDFFRGDSVDFTGLATIQFGGGFGVAKTSTPVSGPNPPVVNQASVYDLKVTASNTGLYQVNAVSVSDPIPAGVEIVSVSATAGTASAAGQNVTWSGFNLQAGGSQSMTIRVSTTPTSSQIGTPVVLNPGAAATGSRAVDGLPQSATSNAVSTENVSGANLAITKTAAPLVVQAGGTVTYTITLTNSGNLAGAVTSVVDHLPAGFSYSSGSTTGTLGAGEPSVSGQDVTWSGAFSVPASASRTLVFDTSASATPGNASNTVDVSGSNFTSTSTGSTATVHVNGPPVVNPDTASVPEDGQVTVSPLTNDSDPDGDALSVSTITQPSHGTAVLNPNGTVTYTPAPNYNGPDSFTVTVCDTNGACASSPVDVTVVPVNDPPVVNDDTATVNEDGQTTVSPLSNDTDPDGDPLSVSTITQPSHGTTVLNPDGTVTYTPAPNYNGPDSF